MQRIRHSAEFKAQALSKARERGTRTLEAVAQDLNISLGTLKGWLKRPRVVGAGHAGALELPSDLAATRWSAAQRLQALCSTHGMAAPVLLIRPGEVSSRIAHAAILEVADDALGALLKHRHVLVSSCA